MSVEEECERMLSLCGSIGRRIATNGRRPFLRIPQESLINHYSHVVFFFQQVRREGRKQKQERLTKSIMCT